MYRGKPIFLTFDSKHRLWALGLGEAVLTCTHDQCFEQKYGKHQTFFMNFSIFMAEKNLCMGGFCNLDLKTKGAGHCQLPLINFLM